MLARSFSYELRKQEEIANSERRQAIYKGQICRYYAAGLVNMAPANQQLPDDPSYVDFCGHRSTLSPSSILLPCSLHQRSCKLITYMDRDLDNNLDWEPKKGLLEKDEESNNTLVLSPYERRLEERAAKAEETRPAIAHLPDAVVVKDGKHILLAKVGDEVIFESVTDGRWNFTKQIVIKYIDDSNGNVTGWDRSRSQYAGFNYNTNDKHGVVVKLLTQSLKKRRRARRRCNV